MISKAMFDQAPAGQAMNVSVVIPAYNRSDTITYCLDSVCNQAVQPLEIIVVDDCSTDATVEVVNNYSRFHPTVRCLALERNSGAQAARNKGIRAAKGDWIAFQDSDDEWDSRKLERQFEALRQVNFEPMTVVHCNCWLDNHQTGARTLWELPLVDGLDVFPRLLTSPGPTFPGILTSKTALEKIGWLDERAPSFQEWDTALRLSKYCRFIHLPEPLFVYHLHSGETISKYKRRHLGGYQYIVDKFKDEIIQKCGVHAYNNHLMDNALNALRWGYYEDAEQILAKCDGKTAKILILKFMARLRINPNFYSSVKNRMKGIFVDVRKWINGRTTTNG